MLERCEWCDNHAVLRITVPSSLERDRPYERFSCRYHERKTQRLVEMDFAAAFHEIGARAEEMKPGG